MRKLGIAVNNLGASQQAFYLINYVNHMLSVHPCDVVVFYQHPVTPCLPLNFGSMQLHEAYSFDGPLITTNLHLANRALNFPGPSQKYFYVWDLEWIRLQQQKKFFALAELYRNPRHKLLARSNEHKKIIEDCWNVSVEGVVDNFNVLELLEIIR